MKHIQSVNAPSGETNDGYLNDIRGCNLSPEAVIIDHRIRKKSGLVLGRLMSVQVPARSLLLAGKVGIRHASRKLPESLGGYIPVGVLVQPIFGGKPPESRA